MCVQGETVPYVICLRLGEDGQPLAECAGQPLSQRAHHVEELRTTPGLVIDADYYLAHQVPCLPHASLQGGQAQGGPAVRRCCRAGVDWHWEG